MLSHFSYVQFFATPWTVAHQPPLSMGFPWQEYWSGLPYPPPGDLLEPGIKSLALQADSLPLIHRGEAHCSLYLSIKLLEFAFYRSVLVRMQNVQKAKVSEERQSPSSVFGYWIQKLTPSPYSLWERGLCFPAKIWTKGFFPNFWMFDSLTAS